MSGCECACAEKRRWRPKVAGVWLGPLLRRGVVSMSSCLVLLRAWAMALEARLDTAYRAGEVPFFVGATAGSTVTGSFDNIHEMAAVVQRQWERHRGATPGVLWRGVRAVCAATAGWRVCPWRALGTGAWAP